MSLFILIIVSFITCHDVNYREQHENIITTSSISRYISLVQKHGRDVGVSYVCILKLKTESPFFDFSVCVGGENIHIQCPPPPFLPPPPVCGLTLCISINIDRSIAPVWEPGSTKSFRYGLTKYMLALA
jgi:hypothetical protein